MKQYFFIVLFFLVLLNSGCQKELFKQPVNNCVSDLPVNPAHPLKDSLQAIINKYVAKGIPGVQVAVKNNLGWFITSGGYARIENKQAFENCSTSWLFSLTKTYTAALIMKLQEKGKLDLDAKLSQYLPNSITQKIAGSDKITVRMLMNHTSGIVNITELPEYQIGQLNNPFDQPSIEEELKMVEGKPLQFEPGSDYAYSNTNYLLLHVLLENVTGKTYEQLLKTEIFIPLQLQHSYYGLTEGQISTLSFPNYYFDRYANEQLENCTRWNHFLANASYGYGGIAATASDAIRFYEALVKGQVVSHASLQAMKTWVQGKESTQPDYGLGLEYYQYGEGSTPQFGHEGDGIGSSTMMLYVPDNNTYLYINITAGRQLFGPYLFKITDLKNELCSYVAK